MSYLHPPGLVPPQNNQISLSDAFVPTTCWKPIRFISGSRFWNLIQMLDCNNESIWFFLKIFGPNMFDCKSSVGAQNDQGSISVLHLLGNYDIFCRTTIFGKTSTIHKFHASLEKSGLAWWNTHWAAGFNGALRHRLSCTSTGSTLSTHTHTNIQIKNTNTHKHSNQIHKHTRTQVMMHKHLYY